MSPTNKEFIDAVFHTIPKGSFVYGTTFKDPPDVVPNGAWFGGVVKARSLRKPSNYTSGDANCFYVVSTFYPDPTGRVFRRKAQFAAACVLTMDDLGDGPSAKISWDHVKLPPSFVIETSPDNCQAGYILSKPETDADLFNRVVDALIHQGLASPVDPGMVGTTRYVRFPVGINNKTKYDPPHVHVCREWHPERRYSLQDIIDAYGLDLAPPAPVFTRQSAVVDSTEDVYLKCLSDLGLVLTGNLRDGGGFEMVDILCPWHDEHTDRIDVGTVYMIGGGFKCMHGHCIDKTFKHVKTKLAASYGVDTNALDLSIGEAHEAKMLRGLEAITKTLNMRNETDDRGE